MVSYCIGSRNATRRMPAACYRGSVLRHRAVLPTLACTQPRNRELKPPQELVDAIQAAPDGVAPPEADASGAEFSQDVPRAERVRLMHEQPQTWDKEAHEGQEHRVDLSHEDKQARAHSRLACMRAAIRSHQQPAASPLPARSACGYGRARESAAARSVHGTAQALLGCACVGILRLHLGYLLNRTFTHPYYLCLQALLAEQHAQDKAQQYDRSHVTAGKQGQGTAQVNSAIGIGRHDRNIGDGGRFSYHMHNKEKGAHGQ
jgi:hypothetical protein